MKKRRKERTRAAAMFLAALLMVNTIDLSALAAHVKNITVPTGVEETHTGETEGESPSNAEKPETFASPSNAEKIKEVKDLIDALPDVSELEEMSREELSEIHEQAQEAYDAFQALTDEEQEELREEFEKLLDLLDYLTKYMMSVEADTHAYAPERRDGYLTAGKCIFANGTAITIEEAPNGTRVWYMDGSTRKYVTENGENGEDLSGWKIFVGSTNADGMTGVNGSVTMTGGTVKEIYAGQYHGGFRGISNITITGGTVTEGIYCNAPDRTSNTDLVNTVTIYDAAGVKIDTAYGKADNVVQKKNGAWSVSGNGVIPGGVTLTVNSGETLTVPTGAALTNNGKLVNDGGTITIYGKLTGNTPEKYVAPSDFTFSPSALKANVSATLETPAASTNNTTLVPWFTFEVADAGTTGAVINGTTITPYGAGTVKVKVLMHDGYCTPIEKVYDFSVSLTPVTEISAEVPSVCLVNKKYTLSAAVTPNDASYKTVSWSIVSGQSETGATVNNGVLTATKTGTFTVRAAVENGTAYGTAYTKDFTVDVKAIDKDSALDISGGSIIISQDTDGTLKVEYSGFGGDGYKNYAANDLIVITGTAMDTYRVIVKSGSPNVVLSDCSITLSGIVSPFEIQPGATVYLTLIGDNLLKNTRTSSSRTYNTTGLSVPENAAVVIEGNGKLEAAGGQYGAGIGGAYNGSKNAGRITINGGTLIVSAGTAGPAGIGGASSGSGGNITINGGTVTVSADVTYGAAIGGGETVRKL